MDGINLTLQLQKPLLNPHRLKFHKSHQLTLKQIGADLLKIVKKKQKEKTRVMEKRCTQMTLLIK